MKKYILIFLLCSFSLSAIDTKILTNHPNIPSPWLVRAYFDTQEQLQKLSDITPLWHVNKKQKFAQLKIDDIDMFNQIQSLKVKLRLDVNSQDKYFTKNEKLNPHYVSRGSNTIDGFSCYSTVEGTFSRMESLVSQHPSLVEIIDIGDSWEKSINDNNGYDLQVLKITNQNVVADKPVVFITSAIHAREYATAELTTRFAEYLLSQYDTDSDIKWMLDHNEVQLLLQTNPDGRKKAESGILWRKNTNQAYCSPNSNSRGADLNRNYPFLWQGSNDQCGETYPGTNAQSEPELISIINHLNNTYEDNRGELITDAAPDDTSGVFLDIHSFSQLVLWPWGFTSNDNPNVNQYKAFGKRVAFFNGYKPEPVSDLTIASGSSIDTTYGDLGIASLAFELGTEFFQDCESFESTILPDNLQALLYITRVARSPYATPFGPDIEGLKIVPNFILPNQNFTLKGQANDDRYNQSNGVQGFENIQQVDMYINDLPWLNQSTQALSASDGAYDTPNESFKSEFNASQLSIGQHTVFAVAKDSNDSEGAVYSKFLNIVEETQIGTISGSITDAITGAVISNAELQINQSFNVTNSSGQYSIISPPVIDDLMIKANGYADKTFSNIEVIQQQTANIDIQLEPFCSVLEDDVESGLQNWTADSPWAIVSNQSNSPTHSWTDSPDGNYADGINTSLTSDNINVEGSTSIELSFNHLCDTEGGFDFGHVEVKFDNANWQNVLSCDGQTEWKGEIESLELPNNTKQIQFRFRLESDNFVTEDGWYIDDVKVKVAGAPCRKIFDDLIFSNGFESN